MEILLAVGIVTAIGVAAGIGLSFASEVMAVPVDEKAAEIAAILPGANCGSCGFSGCAAYAEAISKGEAQPGLCTPGGEAVAAKLSELLGVEVSAKKKFAFVHCHGRRVEDKLDYKGVATCAAAQMFYGGPGSCGFGCIGFGDCAAACEYGAVTVVDGVASVDREKCTGCGKCVKACPKGIITLVSPKKKRIAAVGCSNHQFGKAVRAVCPDGCIGCRLCTKECKLDAIDFVDNLPVINEEKCLGCGKCAAVCPNKVIEVIKL